MASSILSPVLLHSNTLLDACGLQRFKSPITFWSYQIFSLFRDLLKMRVKSESSRELMISSMLFQLAHEIISVGSALLLCEAFWVKWQFIYEKSTGKAFFVGNWFLYVFFNCPASKNSREGSFQREKLQTETFLFLEFLFKVHISSRS